MNAQGVKKAIQKVENSTAPDETSSLIPEEMTEILEAIPEGQRDIVRSMMVTQLGMISRVSPEMDIAKKITSEHIDQMLKTEQEAMQNAFKEKSSNRWYIIAVIGIGSVVMIALVILLKEQPDLLEKIITIVASALLGLAGGYGLGKKSD